MSELQNGKYTLAEAAALGIYDLEANRIIPLEGWRFVKSCTSDCGCPNAAVCVIYAKQVS